MRKAPRAVRQRLWAQEDAVLEAARRFVNERENPAPDMTMRRVDYERLRDAVDAYEQAMLRLWGV